MVLSLLYMKVAAMPAHIGSGVGGLLCFGTCFRYPFWHFFQRGKLLTLTVGILNTMAAIAFPERVQVPPFEGGYPHNLGKGTEPSSR